MYGKQVPLVSVAIITYNQKDFYGVENHFGIKIITPKEFLKIVGETK